MSTLRKLLLRLIPQHERTIIERELDEVASRRSKSRHSIWYRYQLMRFALSIRLEQVALLPEGLAVLFGDFVQATRRLFRRPAYFGTAALTLGLGIGGTVSVYAAANWVLLRDVPGVVNPDELVLVRLETTQDWGSNVTWGVSHPDFQELERRLPSLSGIIASTHLDVQIRVSENPPERLDALLVTGDYFELLGLVPTAGRFFLAADHRNSTGPAEIVIGHDLAVRYWGAVDEAVGKHVAVNGNPYRIIGVTPAGFRGAELPGTASAWLPASAAQYVRPHEPDLLANARVQLWTQLVGRRNANATPPQIAHEANAAVVAIRQLRGAAPHSFMPTHFLFRVYQGLGLDPWIRAKVAQTIAILGVASALLFLLTAANVANLGIARAATRRGEFAIRRALGGSTVRVVRQPVLEGLVIGAGGALIGGLIATGAERVFGEANLASSAASLRGMEIDARVYLFCAAIALLSGVLSAVAPTVAASRGVTSTTLNAHRPGGSTPRRLSGMLVVAQVAVSLVLAVTAGLFARTIINLQRVDLGFDPESTVTFSVDPGLNGYDAASSATFLDMLEQRLTVLPGIESVGLIYPAPMGNRYITQAVRKPEQSEREFTVGGGFGTSGPGTIEALGLRLVAGRSFDVDLSLPDGGGDAVVVSEGMAGALFPELDITRVVGRTVVVGFRGTPKIVAGVVTNARLATPLSTLERFVLQPYSSSTADGEGVFYLRSRRPVEEIVMSVRDIVQQLDTNLPVYDVGTGSDQVRTLLTEQRILARLATILGSLGLALAAIGLYGVLSYSVADRTREIGVRSALGASANTVRREILRSGYAMTVSGLLLAMPLIYMTGKLVASKLYAVSAIDPITIAGGLLLMLAVTFGASWVPARRATRVSPLEALREQ